MENEMSGRSFWSVCLILLGAAVAVFITGTREEWAMGVFFTAAGLAGLVAKPTSRLPWIPLVLGGLYWATTLLVHLPQAWFSTPSWRAGFPASALFTPGSEVAMMPWIAWWWTMILGATVLAGFVMLSAPLRDRDLGVFLHLVAGSIGLYAVVSMVAWQTGWKYPFALGDVFGLLPNRNHTATLLVVGAIISFGLMQWDLTHGHRVGAVFSALCGAPIIAALLFFSISRAGVLLLIVGFILWAIGAARGSTNRKALGVSVVIVIVFAASLFVFGGSTVRNRLGDLWSQALATQAGEEDASNLDFRMPIFQDTVRMISDAPMTGVGMGHFESVFSHYRKASLREVNALHPESDWLMTLAEAGWVAVLVLVVLVVWYFVVCWRSFEREDWLLRWTGASAIGVAVLHAGIDVPWRRLALGWFLLVLALAMIPPRRKAALYPRLMRGWQILVGCGLLGLAGYLFWQNAGERPALAFRWKAYDAEFKRLAAQNKNDMGEFVAREAIRDFPLNAYPYLWHTAFLSTFYGTEGEMKDSAALAWYVDPVQPRIAAGTAASWAPIDPQEEAKAWLEAVRRMKVIEQHQGKKEWGFAGEQIRKAMAAAKDRPEVQRMLGEGIQADSLLLGYWVQYAGDDLVNEELVRIGDVSAFLDRLPDTMREQVLGRLAKLPDTSVALGYMELHEAREPGMYWRVLAKTYAQQGERERAVKVVAKALEVPLEGDTWKEMNDFGRELAMLKTQGNDVAVRRLPQEVLSEKVPDKEKLLVVMVTFAQEGDWEKAWKAASRLAFEVKSSQ